MTIKEAQEAVDQWIKEYGVRYFSELTNILESSKHWKKSWMRNCIFATRHSFVVRVELHCLHMRSAVCRGCVCNHRTLFYIA